MIQPDFCPVPMLCVGCDAEIDSAVWFAPTDGSSPVVLCGTCCAALLFTSANHPKRREKALTLPTEHHSLNER